MAWRFCFCISNLEAAPYCAILFCVLRFIQFGFENYEDIHVKVDPNYEFYAFTYTILKMDSGVQFLHLVADIGMLVGSLRERLWPLYVWIVFATLFLGFVITEMVVTAKAFDSTTVIITMVLSSIEILVSIWGILLVFGATREIKEIRKHPC